MSGSLHLSVRLLTCRPQPEPTHFPAPPTLVLMPLDRRSLLRVGIGGMVGVSGLIGIAGCTNAPLPGTGGSAPFCASRAEVEPHRRLNGARFIYDISGEAQPFRFEPTFFGQLGGWLTDYLELSQLPEPDTISTFGSWLDGEPDCDSWHDAGRAFDLSRLITDGRVQVSCRYDVWKHYRGARLRRFRTSYWGLAASLHLHFASVLTYLYNTDHHNHIHIDNGRSGDGRSTFSRRSEAQVQAVQGMLTHVWDRPVEVTGRWNGATSDACRAVLESTDSTGTLTDGAEQWHAFLRATTSRGSS